MSDPRTFFDNFFSLQNIKNNRYAKYVRERGEVEREYARALRKLVAR